MKINNSSLLKVCGFPVSLPEGSFPQAVFAGRSNVGKSSLINKLLGRRKLARTSSSPGKTATVNFYKVGYSAEDTKSEFVLTDLPGYGYNVRSKESTADWGKMIEGYLKQASETGVLKVIFLLVDSRHIPNDNDIQMYQWCAYYGIPVVVAASKSDKLKRSEKKKKVQDIAASLGIVFEDVVLFSSETGEGISTLLDILEEAVK
ncbi:MAG: ribosome biogenesis GTP-binding protein YihA/YsxC [Lachnospiraceae bacterium]|jgi:GTP-binding protein|nr:ribosome biogenesis GTP-binding protein YihA/YsxC [Lachnospiraceae bacterium]MEE3461076.1 ribosome biogenesis GTP-binding protein YihA/YsxC [Lachnospiraceae bacterium]